MKLDNYRTLLFRMRYGFRGYPKNLHGVGFRIDESLRRFNTGGEEVVQAVLEGRLSEGDTYVDIGANFGMHAMLAAHYVGPNRSEEHTSEIQSQD